MKGAVRGGATITYSGVGSANKQALKCSANKQALKLKCML
jgi:Fe-S cluster assembly scaffold protein SufB